MTEELSPLLPQVWEVLSFLVQVAIFGTVAVVSYRRSRCLSGYPIWKSVLIAGVAGSFWVPWIIVSVVNRNQIAWEWDRYKGRSRPFPDARHPESLSR